MVYHPTNSASYNNRQLIEDGSAVQLHTISQEMTDGPLKNSRSQCQRKYRVGDFSPKYAMIRSITISGCCIEKFDGKAGGGVHNPPLMGVIFRDFERGLALNPLCTR